MPFSSWQLAFIFSEIIDSDDESKSENEEREYRTYQYDWYVNIFTLMFDDQFQEHFRMTKSRFFLIRDRSFHYTSNNPLNHLTKNLLLLLSNISHSLVDRQISALFKIPMFLFFIKWLKFPFLFNINPYLLNQLETKLEQFSKNFWLFGTVSGTLLSVDGMHVPITAPRESSECYYNRQQYYSINWLIAADAKKKIRYITNNIGSAHDSRILRTSLNLLDFLNNLPQEMHIIGDKAFRGHEKIWVPGVTTNIESNDFDNQLAKQRLIVENTFPLFQGKLKRFYHKQVNGHSPKTLKILVWAITIHTVLIE